MNWLAWTQTSATSATYSSSCATKAKQWQIFPPVSLTLAAMKRLSLPVQKIHRASWVPPKAPSTGVGIHKYKAAHIQTATLDSESKECSEKTIKCTDKSNLPVSIAGRQVFTGSMLPCSGLLITPCLESGWSYLKLNLLAEVRWRSAQCFNIMVDSDSICLLYIHYHVPNNIN